MFVLVFLNIFTLLGMGILLAELHVFRRRQMASAQDLNTSFNALSAAVANLLAAKQNGVDPAALDPVKQAMDQLTQQIQTALTPAG